MSCMIPIKIRYIFKKVASKFGQSTNGISYIGDNSLVTCTLLSNTV